MEEHQALVSEISTATAAIGGSERATEPFSGLSSFIGRCVFSVRPCLKFLY
jgi:hypothetical protein